MLPHFDFSKFNLSGVALIGAELNKANFSEANLHGAGLLRAKLRGATFAGADLSNAVFTQADLSQANLDRADLSATKFTWATLKGTHLKAARNLKQADFTSATFCQIDLSGTDLSGAQLDLAHFKYVDLHAAHLNGAALPDANLREADLRSASLGGANLVGAHLSSANLAGANLIGAHLSSADCTGASFQGANLSRANVVWTNFTGAILTNCRVYGISAWNVQLSGAIRQHLIITDEEQPPVTIDDLRLAQFLHLLVTSQQVRQALNPSTTRIVPILSRMAPEQQPMLDILREALRQHHYQLLCFPFPAAFASTSWEVVSALVGLACFLLLDLTDDELAINETTFAMQPLALETHAPVDGILLEDLRQQYHWIRPTIFFGDNEELQSWLGKRI